MDLLYWKIGLIYERYRNQFIMAGPLLLGFVLFVMFSFALNAQQGTVAGINSSDNVDNGSNTDNIAVLLVSTLPTLTDLPISTIASANTLTVNPTNVITNTPRNAPTTKPTAKPTSQPTNTAKPSPTKTTVPTKTAVPTLIPTSKPTPTVIFTNATCDPNYTSALFAEINKYRASKGRTPYNLDNTVSIAACNHSYWMQTTGIFSHTGINGTSASQRCTMVGTTCRGENIIRGDQSFVNPVNAVRVWSSDSAHDQNLLGAYTWIGIGRSGQYVVVDFAF